MRAYFTIRVKCKSGSLPGKPRPLLSPILPLRPPQPCTPSSHKTPNPTPRRNRVLPLPTHPRLQRARNPAPRPLQRRPRHALLATRVPYWSRSGEVFHRAHRCLAVGQGLALQWRHGGGDGEVSEFAKVGGAYWAEAGGEEGRGGEVCVGGRGGCLIFEGWVIVMVVVGNSDEGDGFV